MSMITDKFKEELARSICTIQNKCHDCSKYECQAKDTVDIILRGLSERASRLRLHFREPQDTRFAVVEYSCQRGKPLKVASYYTYGIDIKTGEDLICWHWLPSTNFRVLEDGFTSKEDADKRLKELREKR